MKWLLLLGLPPGTTAVVWAQIDPNPETPTSILAAVIFLGTVIVLGLLAALRMVWGRYQAALEAEKATRSEKDKEIAGLNAAAINRERELGFEHLPLLREVSGVLQSLLPSYATAARAAKQVVEQPVPELPAVVDRLSAVVAALEAKERQP